MEESKQPALKEIEERLKKLAGPLLEQAAECYIKHIDNYAREAASKKENELDAPHRGLFLDFKQEPGDGSKKHEVKYAGEALGHFLEPYPFLSDMIESAKDQLLDFLESKYGKPRETRESDRNVRVSRFYDNNTLWFQERMTYYPDRLHFVLLKRLEEKQDTPRNAAVANPSEPNVNQGPDKAQQTIYTGKP